MNLEEVKQIVETIKTLNLNINSSTGRDAIIAVADKVGFYLIVREVIGVVMFMIGMSALFTLLILGYRLIKQSIDRYYITESLRKLDLDEELIMDAINGFVKSFEAKDKIK